MSAMEAASKCVAAGGSCEAGLAYFKRWHALAFRGQDPKLAADLWDKMVKRGDVKCK
jgi:hypothetical protein